MDKIEQLAVIKYLHKKGLMAKQIHEDMEGTLGQSAPSYTIVKKWAAEFKCGWESIKDDPHSGRPSTLTTQEYVEKICDLIIGDRRLKIREIVETVCIPYERAQNIIVNKLGFSKISARWISRLLSVKQNRNRLTISRDSLELFEVDPQEFSDRFVTMDETWVHHYTSESKQQSKQWKWEGSPPPKKAKIVFTANKVITSVSWDLKGVILVDYLEKSKTVNSVIYYCTFLHRLLEEIKEKSPGMLWKKVLFN